MVVHKKVPKRKINPNFPDDDWAKQARKQIEKLYEERSPIRLELLEKYTDDDEVKIYTEIKDYIIYSNDYYLSKLKVNNKWVVTYRVNKYGAITKHKKYLNIDALSQLCVSTNEQDLCLLRSAKVYSNKCIGVTTATLYPHSANNIEDVENYGDIVAMIDEYGRPTWCIRDRAGILKKIQTAEVLKTTEIY